MFRKSPDEKELEEIFQHISKLKQEKGQTNTSTLNTQDKDVLEIIEKNIGHNVESDWDDLFEVVKPGNEPKTKSLEFSEE